jgi:type I restriction enzyme, R subunit
MNEADTRAEKIDPQLKKAGWGTINNSKIRREYFTNNESPFNSKKDKKKADYVLIYKNRRIAVVEAKSDELEVSEGISQAKDYARRLNLLSAYSTNGKEIYEIRYSINSEGKRIINSEGLIKNFPSPDDLWNRIYKNKNVWSNKFDSQSYSPFKNTKNPRYYQDVAITAALDAISDGKNRILLTLATGTGKTVIAFQIVWKLFNTKWNRNKDGNRTPRILFLADRNILANQAYNSFGAFPENALTRVSPSEIKQQGKVPKNASIYFSIFQTFMSGPNESSYFGEYPKDFFDLIIIDECHRGGANDESNWRDILDYFSSAVQIGLTATPKRNNNVDTYSYFGNPVYTYSLKDGIEDEYLTPFRVDRIQTTIDDYRFIGDDKIIKGENEINKKDIFKEEDFNRIIEIKEREKKRIQLLLETINQNEKTIIFCANIRHASMVRELINSQVKNKLDGYCERVTSDDGEIGEIHLRQFQDNEKNIPTILTTSEKLSTGVDALNIRNIVLMRPVNNMIEFKQIIGRGTRLFEGKKYFNIIDFVGASENFSDPDWDGEPLSPKPRIPSPPQPPEPPEPPEPPNPTAEMIVIELAEGKELQIQSMSTKMFYFDNKTISASEFVKKLFKTVSLPKFFENEEELKKLWSSPITRKELLIKLEENGFSKDKLKEIQDIINANDSDLFDVLEYVAYNVKPITRLERVERAEKKIHSQLDENQKDFIDFVLSRYVEGGVEELDDNVLSKHLKLKYKEIYDAENALGDLDLVKKTFIEFQKNLY